MFLVECIYILYSNQAILSYLKKYNYNESYKSFKNEAKVDDIERKTSTLDLEYKWGAVIRLQSEIHKLNKNLSETQKELKEAKPFDYNDFVGPKKLYDERIPNKTKYVLRGHTKSINFVKFHPTYAWLVTCSDNNRIGLWDYETGKLVKMISGHKSSVNCCVFNKYGTYLATGSRDMSIKIWDFEDEFQCIKTLNGHDNSVTGIGFCNNDTSIISCSRDGNVKLWDISTGYCKHTYNDTHDGEWVKKVIVSNDNSIFATCSIDFTIKIFDLKNGNELQILKGHEHVVETILFSNPNLDNIINNKPLRFNINNNNNNNNSNKLLIKKLKYNKNNNNKLNSDSDNDDINDDLLPKHLISGSRDKTIMIWNIKTGKLIFKLIGHDNWITSLTLMSNGMFLFSSSDDKSIIIWDLNKKKEYFKINNAHDGFVSCLDWHPTQCLLVSGSNKNDVKIWHHNNLHETTSNKSSNNNNINSNGIQ